MNARDLENAWDAGVEQALDDATRTEELEHEKLNQVAGLNVQAGIKGGMNWDPSLDSCMSCHQTCVGIC